MDHDTVQTAKITKQFVGADQFTRLSFRLADKIHKSGIKVNWVVSLWRGGAPAGLCVQEYLQRQGHYVRHCPIIANSYAGMIQHEVQVGGFEYLAQNIPDVNSLQPVTIVLIDDMFESGRTIAAVCKRIREFFNLTKIDIYVGTIFWKPEKNLTARTPDFYCETTKNWIVFAHEVNDLSDTEILNWHPDIAEMEGKSLD